MSPPVGTDLESVIRQLAYSVQLLASRRKMPPHEEIGYFFSPNVILTSLAASAPWKEIVPQNPQRVAIVLSGGGNFWWSPDSSIALTLAGSPTGIFFNSGGLPIILTEQEHGILATCALFAQTTIVCASTAIEVVLRQWPG